MEDVRIGDSDMRIPTRTREIYIGTPDRPRKDKRRGDLDDMDEDINKARRISLEFEEGDAMSIPGSRDDQPDTKLINMGNEIFVRMDEVDRKILAAAVLGVDITTEVYSPERIAKVARKFGRVRAGSSLDFTNG